MSYIESMWSSTVFEWWNMHSNTSRYLHMSMSTELYGNELSNIQSMYAKSVPKQWHMHYVNVIKHIVCLPNSILW